MPVRSLGGFRGLRRGGCESDLDRDGCGIRGIREGEVKVMVVGVERPGWDGKDLALDRPFTRT